MSTVYEGNITGKGRKFAVVVSRFNEFVSLRLLEGAMDCLRRHGTDDDDITIAWVPGAFDIPAVAKRMGDAGSYDAVICLGVVIRGATPHFDYVASEVAKGVAHVAAETGVPAVFGVVTADSLEQAMERAGLEERKQGLGRRAVGHGTGRPLRGDGIEGVGRGVPLMEVRRQGRELAVMLLYREKLTGLTDLGIPDIDDAAAEARAFAATLVAGVREGVEGIDRAIAGASEHWDISRMGIVDLTVLRIGVYELLERPDTPVGVIINEAVEIARKYSSDDCGKFVNGVLDRIAGEVRYGTKAQD